MFPNRITCFSTLGLLVLLPSLAPPAAASASPSASAAPAFVYEATTAEKAAPAGRPSRSQLESPVIAVDLGLLSRDPDQLQVALPDGQSFLAYRTMSWTEEGDRRYWSGELRRDGNLEGLPDGFISLAADGDFVAGSVTLGQESFEIVPLEKGRQRLIRAARAAGAGAQGSYCALAATEEAAAGPPAVLPKDTKKEKEPGGAVTAVIDVLAIFPQSLGTAQNLQQTRARIVARFAEANQVLQNSNTQAQFRLVFSAPLLGEQPPVAAGPGQLTPGLALQWLREGRSEVIGLRQAVGADFVALFVPGDQNINCGAADISGAGAYAVIDLDCAPGEYVVAHELGHLLGLRHPAEEYISAGVPVPSAPYAFAFGYDADNQLMVGGSRAATVVACNGLAGGLPINTLTGIQCNRLPFYSSPNIQVGGGVSLGTATNNNAEVARLQAPSAAALTPTMSIVNMPPTITLLRPQGTSAQAYQSLTLEATALDYEDGDRSAAIQWSSNLRGYLGAGTLLRVPGTVAGNETITASVADLGGLTASSSKTVQHVAMVDTLGAIWHNPNSPDRYLSFNKNIYNQWVATWMAYEGTAPVWYQSDVVPVSPGNGSFSAQLVSYTRDPWTGVQTGTPAGVLSISVETERQIRLQITSGPAGPVDLMLEPYTYASGPGSYWSVIPQGWPPEYVVDGGWMIWRGPVVGAQMAEEARLLITFDGSSPVWLIGIGSPPNSGSSFGITMNRLSPGSGSFSAGRLVFFTDRPAGFVELTFPSGNTWIRYEQRIEAATVR